MKKFIMTFISALVISTGVFAAPVKNKQAVIMLNKAVPVNIELVNEESYTINLFVPGFDKSEFSVKQKSNVLTVKTEASADTKKYVFKGFTKKSFTQQFTLNDNVEIKKVTMNNGIMVIELYVNLPEKDKTKVIKID